MRVLHAAAECLPFATTGGLGDVVGALPGAQRALGCDARIMLPCYGFLSEEMRAGTVIDEFEAGGRRARIIAAERRANGAPVYLCEMPGLFDRGGDPYRDEHGREFTDNAQRFAAFCAAVVRVATCDPHFAPQVVHLHDWHTALVAALLRQQRWRGVSALSIHNLAYQAHCERPQFIAAGLPPALWEIGAGNEGRWSFLRAGIRSSEPVIAVSPTYAAEIQTAAAGCGLDALLRERAAAGALHGVVNGIDTQSWNPATDAALVRRYDASTVAEGKRANRHALQAELGLPAVERPLLAFIGRLTSQKGADLIAAAGDALHALPAQYVLVGLGEPGPTAALQAFDAASPHAAFRAVYDPALARRVMAAADALLMPSRFEPCGMTQLYAQRYGTIPVVRRTGGLCDTVVDARRDTLDAGSASGVLFDDADIGGLLYGVQRVLALIADAPTLAALRRAGMSRDSSWAQTAPAYLQLYATPRTLHECGKDSVFSLNAGTDVESQ